MRPKLWVVFLLVQTVGAQGAWTVCRTSGFQFRHASELGQSIAHARVNGITVPWTEEQEHRKQPTEPSAPSVEAKRTIVWNGRKRTFALLVPSTQRSVPLPVLVLHHGTGGSGAAMVELWRSTAEKEGIILVAPDGLGRYGWSVPDDGPELQQEILAQLQSEYRIDPRRIYLFGFSAGGDFAFFAALQQSRYFAAACIHEASLRPRQFPMLELAERRIPIFYSVGIDDPIYPLAETQATQKAFKQRKWPFKMVEGRIGHSYNPRQVNPECWKWLKKQSLPTPPAKTVLSDRWLSYALVASADTEKGRR